MADDEVTPFTTSTVNYGWVKPDVGASDDAWGGLLNTDLDGIDSTVKSVSNAIPAASSTTPAMDGTATIGTGTTFARADHIHPIDTSRYAASNPSGYQTAAQVTTALAPYAPLASPALTGNPTAPTPTAGDNDTSVATTAFVTAAITTYPVGDNRLINGDMRIDQRNNGASSTGSGYTVDRWVNGVSTVGKLTWGRNLNSISWAVGFPYYLGCQSASAYSVPAGEIYAINQYVEADMVSDFAFGTANAQPITLSFWAQSSKTGTFSGSIGNYAATRSYPFTYSLPTANTWTKIVVTIPGDTGGTWQLAGPSGALFVSFDLGSGATYRGAAGAWASSGYYGATGAQSIVATLNATFYVTGVKLEIGSVATPYNRQSLAKSMADCQRYYTTGIVGTLDVATGASEPHGSTATFSVQMRSTATITPFPATVSINITPTTFAADNATSYGFRYYYMSAASGGLQGLAAFTASAEL